MKMKEQQQRDINHNIASAMWMVGRLMQAYNMDVTTALGKTALMISPEFKEAVYAEEERLRKQKEDEKEKEEEGEKEKTD